MELRDYQIQAIEKLRNENRSGKSKICFVAPTGAGKSIVFGQIIKNAIEKGNRVLWLVHRRNLVNQMKEVLESHFGVNPGVIMAGIEPDSKAQVQLCTIQTYSRRLNLDEKDLNPFYVDAKVILVDEAHRSCSKSYQDVLRLYKDKIILGFTATPCRSDGRGLGEIYESIVEVTDVKKLTEEGHLAKARYFEAQRPDLSDVKIAMGDYVVKDLDRKMNTKKLVGDIVENWLKYGENRKTIVFCVNVKHSMAVCEAFNKTGVPAEHLSARSTDEERDEVFRRMNDGDIRIVCNVALYQEGLDVPDVSCIVFARPTKSLGLYRQCVGRGLRPAGNDDCLIFDHGGVIAENGFADDEVVWSLDGKEQAWKVKKSVKEKKPVKCSVCNLIFEGVNVCPDCGSPVKTFSRKIDTEDGELKEIKGKRASIIDKRMYLGMLRYWVSSKGYSPKMVNAKYRSEFGCWPHSKIQDVAPIQPDQNFLNKMKHDFIRYAKGKKHEHRPSES